MSNIAQFAHVAEVSSVTKSGQPAKVLRLQAFAGFGKTISFVVEPMVSESILDTVVRIHPVFLEFLDTVFSFLPKDSTKTDSETKGYCGRSVRLESMRVPNAAYSGCRYDVVSQIDWFLTQEEYVSIAENAVLEVKVVYSDIDEVDHLVLANALSGCLIQEGTYILLDTLDGYMVVNAKLKDGKSSLIYRVDKPAVLCLHRTPGLDMVDPPLPSEVNRITAPGYEKELNQLAALVRMEQTLAPRGILLSGSSGVGKSRLAQSLQSLLSRSQEWLVHSVSCQSLILESAQATEGELLEQIIPKGVTGRRILLVLEDLDTLANEDESSELDTERRLVLLCILQGIDVLVQTEAAIVGVGRSRNNLPSELTKSTRLEKEIVLPSPSEHQRQQILEEMLVDLVTDNKDRLQWTNSLAAATAGCVARDLQKLCADIATQVWARKEKIASWDDATLAIQRLIPSQLALLDVIKPPEVVSRSETNLEEHFRNSWASFVGYEMVKRRLYFSVYLPWRSQLRGGKFSLDPTTGILFHGPSGCGKSLAATCLGSSLGLPMIQVRASDVLDKYVGSSEAIIRSIFARARSAAPCIVWLDEVDAIASNRDDESTGVMSRLLSSLLNEMDGISSGSSTSAKVFVIACTNRLSSLDSALIRPGRLEEHVFLDLPDQIDIAEMLRRVLSSIPPELQTDNFNFDKWSRYLVELGATVADVHGVLREAILRTFRGKASTTSLFCDDDIASAVSCVL